MSRSRLLSTKLRRLYFIHGDPLKFLDKGGELKVIILEDLSGDNASWVEGRKSKIRDSNEETFFFYELT